MKKTAVRWMLAALSAGLAVAQPAERNIMRIDSFHVKAANVSAFEASAKENVAMLTKASARHDFTVWRSDSGDLDYMRIDLFSKWAELDRNSYADLTAIAAERARILAAIDARIEDTHRMIMRILPGAGMPLDSIPPMVEIEWRRVPQGKAAEFTPLASEFVQQWKKAGVEFCFAARIVYGGPSNQFAQFTGLANWAALDGESSFHKLIGDEGFKRYSERLTPLTAEVHRDVYRFCPELSYLPNLKSARK